MGHPESERRSALLSVKLRALVRDHLGLVDDPTGSVEPFALGAAFRADDALWILVDGDASRSLGPVLAWAGTGNQPMTLPINLLVERDSGVLVRRARLIDAPVTVWHVEDRRLLPAVPDPYPEPSIIDPRHGAFVELIRQAGAEPLIEHGVVIGEVRGLEMCRVVDDAVTGDVRLEVGMGRHDREAFAMVHGDLPTKEAMRQVIDAVLPHRSDGADPHPFNKFGAERLLRWRAMQNPSSVGLTSLSPVDPPVIRANVKDPLPCVARGSDEVGNEAAVVFVHGIDLDVVPFAVDAAVGAGLDRAIVVARDKDIVSSIRTMARAAAIPTSIVGLG